MVNFSLEGKIEFVPMFWVKLMAGRGIQTTDGNLTTWFKTKIFCVNMDRKLFPKDRIAAGDYNFITNICSKLTSEFLF